VTLKEAKKAWRWLQTRGKHATKRVQKGYKIDPFKSSGLVEEVKSKLWKKRRRKKKRNKPKKRRK